MTLLEARTRELTGHRLFVVVAVPLFVLYLVTAKWTLPYNIDPVTNVFSASEMGRDGDVFLEDLSALAEEEYGVPIPWVVPARDSFAAQYPPGAAALAAPLYAVWPATAITTVVYGSSDSRLGVETSLPPLAPAAIISAAVAAIAVGLLALAFRELADGFLAVTAGYVVGLGTGIWPVAADALWQHGPAMMWLAAGTVLSNRRQGLAGLAFGAAILTRPHTAFVGACNGLWQAWEERSIRPAVIVGAGSTAGLMGLIMYNHIVFGSPSITGGYSDRFLNRTASLDVLEYVGNVTLALVHPIRGLLVFSPFLVLLIPGLRAAWQAAPAWVRGSAIGGLLYLLVQLKANRYSGGTGFWAYRYPLETLAAAAPLLLLAYTQWVVRQSGLIQRLFRWLVGGSILLTAIGAIFF